MYDGCHLHGTSMDGVLGFGIATKPSILGGFLDFTWSGKMGKLFKDYDKKYSKFAGTALKTIASLGGHIASEDITSIDRWHYIYRFSEAYTREQIHEAVYSSEVWQMFRVSLKGLTTREKLYALGWYWDVYISPGMLVIGADTKLQIVRVNNYLGALKRGGFLDSQLHVIKDGKR